MEPAQRSASESDPTEESIFNGIEQRGLAHVVETFDHIDAGRNRPPPLKAAEVVAQAFIMIFWSPPSRRRSWAGPHFLRGDQTGEPRTAAQRRRSGCRLVSDSGIVVQQKLEVPHRLGQRVSRRDPDWDVQISHR